MNWMIPLQKQEYIEMENFQGHIARVKIGKKFGFINEENKIVIPPIYDGAYQYGDSVIIVK